MAHFAQIDSETNKVLNVLVVPDSQEHRGQEFLNNLGLSGTWIQTSYNNSIRKNFAGIGFTYDAERDAFIPPQIFPSWILNEDTCRWEPPLPLPENPHDYFWHEPTVSWKLIPSVEAQNGE